MILAREGRRPVQLARIESVKRSIHEPVYGPRRERSRYTRPRERFLRFPTFQRSRHPFSLLSLIRHPTLRVSILPLLPHSRGSLQDYLIYYLKLTTWNSKLTQDRDTKNSKTTAQLNYTLLINWVINYRILKFALCFLKPDFAVKSKVLRSAAISNEKQRWPGYHKNPCYFIK